MVRAMFPGTFDPIHFGHIDIATRAARLFDEVVVAVYDRPLKSLMFSPEERIALVNQALDGHDRIRVVSYSGMTVDFCRKIGAQVVVRGLRVFSDFEFEFRMALANHRLAGRGRLEHGAAARQRRAAQQSQGPERPAGAPVRD